MAKEVKKQPSSKKKTTQSKQPDRRKNAPAGRSPSRRKAPALSEADLYKTPDIESFIEKERRETELSRLNEVKKQKSMWKKTMVACALLNLTFIALGILGYFQP